MYLLLRSVKMVRMLSGLGGRQVCCRIYWQTLECVAYKFKSNTSHTHRNIIQNSQISYRKGVEEKKEQTDLVSPTESRKNEKEERERENPEH